MSQQINLFNPVFLKQEKHFSALTMLQALVLILLCSILLTAYSTYQLASLQNDASRTAAQLQLTQNQLAKVTAEYGPKQKDAKLEEKVQRMEADVQSLRHVSDILKKGEFGNTDGYAAYMSAFARQIVDGVWLTGFSIQGAANDLSIQGGALRPELVPVYLNRLKSESVMRGASFATLEMALPKTPADQTAKTEQKAPVATYVNFKLHSSVVGKDLPAEAAR
jgi:Tfp pilus assembly protein PilN